MAGSHRVMTAPVRPSGLDPLRSLWNLLTNVKFALLLVGTALLAGLVGVVVPQMPAPMRSNPVAQEAWLELRREKFGFLTDVFREWGLFDVFHTWWFNGLWLLIIVAVTVCTVSRFQPTWRGVHRPTKRVGDGYFERAAHGATFTHAGGLEAVEGLLRKKRYRVERVEVSANGGRLFAERYAWSQYGTFLSHLALLMLLIGALLTTLAGFNRTLVLAEGTPGAPVFDEATPGQIFVRMVDAFRGMDGDGNIIDYHSNIEVRQGSETVRCKTTVNDPCTAFGYKVHQAAWFNDLARLKVTDPSGRVLYDDVMDFESRSTPLPLVRVRGANGDVLFQQVLPQMDIDVGASEGTEDDVSLALLNFPKVRGSNDVAQYVVGWKNVDNRLQVTLQGERFSPVTLAVGEPYNDGDYEFLLEGQKAVPAQKVADMPGAITEDGGVMMQMAEDAAGTPYLMVAGLDLGPVVMEEGKPVSGMTGYVYEFNGRVEASGVSVRRDPGDRFIWIAVAMATIGLAITFYVPRRRLWVKVEGERTSMAGVAERTTRFDRELRLMGAELGAADALQPGDRGEE